MPKDKDELDLSPIQAEDPDLDDLLPKGKGKKSDYDLDPIEAEQPDLSFADLPEGEKNKELDLEPIEALEPGKDFDLFGMDETKGGDKNPFDSIADAIVEYNDDAAREKDASKRQRESEKAMMSSGFNVFDPPTKGKSGRGKANFRY